MQALLGLVIDQLKADEFWWLEEAEVEQLQHYCHRSIASIRLEYN